MSLLPTKPRVTYHEHNVQLSYETPHNIHDFKCYPIIAPNGSSVLIYAHRNGLRLIWKGGRQFKDAGTPRGNESKSNGSNEDAVMIIDSDDEQNDTDKAQDADFRFEDALFEDEQDDDQNSGDSENHIVQQLDLDFGTSVLRIAVPPDTFADAAKSTIPEILRDRIVVAVACADHLIRLVSLPLTPPSPAIKEKNKMHTSFSAILAGSGKWQETITTLHGQRATSNSLSVTFIPVREAGSSEAGSKRSRSRSRTRRPAKDWRILVASHTRELSGVLRLYRLSIQTVQHPEGSSHTLTSVVKGPFQIQYLASPAISISFNPSIFAPQNATQLLVAQRNGACKIYDCQSGHAQAEDSGPLAYATQGGLWLLTMYTGFQGNQADNVFNGNTASASSYGRKIIADAQWVIGGKAVMVLLIDGEWGIWELEHIFSASSKGMFGRQGIRGGAKTAFTLSGAIEGLPTRSSSRPAGTQNTTFAPMTPGTRRTIETALFSGKTASDFLHGQISTKCLPTLSTAGRTDECVVLWLGDSYSVIPSLLTYWESHIRKSNGSGNLFGRGIARVIKVDGVNLRGAMCLCIDQISRKGKASGQRMLPEFLVASEHRYVVVSDKNEANDAVPESLVLRPAERELTLAEGVMDIADLDRALARMEDTPIFGSNSIRV